MVEIDIQGVGRFVQDSCVDPGCSQRELSRRSGVPQTAVSRLVRGRVDAVDVDQLLITSSIGGRIHLDYAAVARRLGR